MLAAADWSRPLCLQRRAVPSNHLIIALATKAHDRSCPSLHKQATARAKHVLVAFHANKRLHLLLRPRFQTLRPAVSHPTHRTCSLKLPRSGVVLVFAEAVACPALDFTRVFCHSAALKRPSSLLAGSFAVPASELPLPLVDRPSGKRRGVVRKPMGGPSGLRGFLSDAAPPFYQSNLFHQLPCPNHPHPYAQQSRNFVRLVLLFLFV